MLPRAPWTPWTSVFDGTARPAVYDRLALGPLHRLEDPGETPGRLSAGVALVADPQSVILASTDERARALGRLQFEEGTGSGPRCLADGRPSRMAPPGTSGLARLERELGITHRLSVLIGAMTDDPPAVLTCWSTNGEVDEEHAAMTAMDIAALVHRARSMFADVRRAASLDERLRRDEIVAIATGMMMEASGLTAGEATHELRRRAGAAGRTIEDEARHVVDTAPSGSADR